MKSWCHIVAVGFAALGAVGCVDKEKCDEAIRVTRDALSKDQPDIARQWRDRAWKICNDSEKTAPLDKEITDKEAEAAKKAADLAKGVATAAQQRMNQAQGVWLAFDKLPEKDHTLERLDAHRDTAARMSNGLPPEYAQQVETYNAQQYANRKASLPTPK
ncbi:MAG TPA: hypothetical protein VHE30_24810 [Polyangiaceae bacterium]|nr:hypothetical protein [Polyangiaceae bacterium]